MRTILLIALLALPVAAQAQYVITPDGSYVAGNKWQITPDGKYIPDFGHGSQITPGGNYVPALPPGPPVGVVGDVKDLRIDPSPDLTLK